MYSGALRGGGDRTKIFQRIGASRSWSQLDNPADGPERRSHCSLVGDPTRQRLILSGGQGPGEAKPNWFSYEVASSSWSAIPIRPYDPLGATPGRLMGAASFFDPVDGAVTLYGGERRELEILVDSTWRLRQVGDACDAGQACANGLTCVEGACCEATACGPCESCAMPDRRGICTARGVVESTPGCPAEQGLACNADGRCRAGAGATCTEDAQCASGACAGGECCPAEGCAERCLDPSTQKNKDGTSSSCGAYLCKGTACLAACNSVEDCATGHDCSLAKQCVPAELASTEQDGCSCDLTRSRLPPPWSALGALLLLGVRRRARRA